MNKKPIHRPRVLHIISGDRWAGAEAMAYNLIIELSHKIDVAVIVLNKGELAHKLQRKGIRTIVLDESCTSPFKIFTETCKIINDITPTTIHTHRLKENILGSLTNLITIRARCIRTIHGAPEFTSSGISKLWAIIDRACGNFLQDRIITVSSDLENKMSCKFNPWKLVTITNGINPEILTEQIEEPEFHSSQPNLQHIGIVGRLDPVKRVDIFIRTALKILDNSPESSYHFHIFGEGGLQSELIKLRDSLGLKNEITFHGYRSDIRDCIAFLDVLVMCSDHEGLPMTALEALALQTPCVCHDVGGLSEIFSAHPEFLVKNHSPEGYSKKVLEILKSKAQPPSLPQKYHIASVAERTIEIYKLTGPENNMRL